LEFRFDLQSERGEQEYDPSPCGFLFESVHVGSWLLD
jgi:hypothetical protein